MPYETCDKSSLSPCFLWWLRGLDEARDVNHHDTYLTRLHDMVDMMCRRAMVLGRHGLPF